MPQLINDDLRARDHLANERTYLAWLRTGLATMGFGVVIAKLRYFVVAIAGAPIEPGVSRASEIGIMFAFVGLAMVLLATLRYNSVRHRLRKNIFRSASAVIAVTSAIVMVLGFLILWYLMPSGMHFPF